MADYLPTNQNVEGPSQLVSSGLNKVSIGATEDEGVEGEYKDELSIDLDDEELLDRAQQAESLYRPYNGKILPRQNRNEAYYLGKINSDDANASPISSNLIFEAFETFLAAALAKNPEPVVYSDNSQPGTDVSGAVKTMLQYHADILAYRRKLTAVTRSHGINLLGVMKYGWDSKIKDITCDVRNPRDFIFDPDAFVDSYGDMEGMTGERVTVTARKLVELFPKHEDFIKIKVLMKMGTKVTYTEWWDDDFTFTTFEGKVLDKAKNPFFNYPVKEPQLDPTGQPVMDAEGKPVMQDSQVWNHFGKAKKPYTFLSVFSFQQQPHDVTGLIEQNIRNQNRITRRTDQIDLNLSQANNSLALSGDNFNEDTGKQAASARRGGRPILVPSGKPIAEAIVDLGAPGFPSDAFTELETSKNDLRSIFGTQGITSQPANEDTTARGMILNQQYDNSRIGGGIGDALEQFADNSFNWFTQLYYVFYDEPHFAAIMGNLKAVEYVELSQQDMQRRLVVSVSPDSMKSHDELTEMNQAMELFQAGIMDPKTLFTILNVPDAQDTSEQAVLWKLDPQAYMQLNFPDLAQQLQQMQQQTVAAAGGQPAGAPAPQGEPSGSGPPAEPTAPEAPPTLSVPPAGSSLSAVPLPQ
jgi:hypothetical protein